MKVLRLGAPGADDLTPWTPVKGVRAVGDGIVEVDLGRGCGGAVESIRIVAGVGELAMLDDVAARKDRGIDKEDA